jgi:hypothetical protein
VSFGRGTGAGLRAARVRMQGAVASGLRRAVSLPRADRSYYLALAEYQRRRRDPIPELELRFHELSISSQNGEDGVIQEILRRSGVSERPYFVEFGVSAAEGCAILLTDLLGWSGLFIEADTEEFHALRDKYANENVSVLNETISPDNVEALFRRANVPEEPDLLSIDIDGNDYWVWKAIDSYRPRVVVIEFNSSLPAASELVQPPSEESWDTAHFGASLGALIALGREKGYRLVHTEVTGANAFFVRDDLPAEWPAPRLAGPNYVLRGRGHPGAGRESDYVSPTTVGRPEIST